MIAHFHRQLNHLKDKMEKEVHFQRLSRALSVVLQLLSPNHAAYKLRFIVFTTSLPLILSFVVQEFDEMTFGHLTENAILFCKLSSESF